MKISYKKLFISKKIFLFNIYMSNNNIGVNKITRGNLLSINDYFVKKVEELGYDRDYIIKCLEKNELNSATTAYYLFSIYENIKS